MEASGYTTLTRQSGLMREMQLIANNVANISTTGFRQEGLLFSEFIKNMGDGTSLSMASARVHRTSFDQGQLGQTGGQLDVAIEGDGFFLIETPDGERLTRAGSFSPNSVGDLVNMDGLRVLDAGGAPIFIPPNASDISIAPDGTIGTEDRLIGQIAIVVPTDPEALKRETGVLFHAETGFEPLENGRMAQGFLESSNVDPILQMARMIEVQRAYELGQNFLKKEDERVRSALQTFVK
ncbi:MAG: flagellar hook-basal body complex protein [Pseudoprimorskyibacter sp.]|nr:flagellar hook-basal body complex protein [Pseudoprimorskyibacter sp.]